MSQTCACRGVAPENATTPPSCMPHQPEHRIPIFRLSQRLHICYNALAKKTRSCLCPAKQADRHRSGPAREMGILERYEGRMRETATRVNNAYLMAMSQKDGAGWWSTCLSRIMFPQRQPGCDLISIISRRSDSNREKGDYDTLYSTRARQARGRSFMTMKGMSFPQPR